MDVNPSFVFATRYFALLQRTTSRREITLNAALNGVELTFVKTFELAEGEELISSLERPLSLPDSLRPGVLEYCDGMSRDYLQHADSGSLNDFCLW